MLRIDQVRLLPSESQELIPEKIKKKAGVKGLEITSYRIVKEAVDARRRQGESVSLVYSVEFDVKLSGKSRETAEEKVVKLAGKAGIRRVKETEAYETELVKNEGKRPVVIGFGPCGMAAAIKLSEAGLRPLVFERGRKIEERVKDVLDFSENGILDPESNIQFGEGGAGTFSDGKLTTGTHDPRIKRVLEIYHEAGAPDDILYRSKPHIGTDILRNAVVNIRKKIESLGGEIVFDSKLTGIDAVEGRLNEIEITPVRGEDMTPYKVPVDHVILAPGHSARDTFRLLHKEGAEMEKKPFSVGVRIEHLQSTIDRSQFGDEIFDEIGDEAVRARLGPAEYKLSHHCADGRGVYTFCMCPGGYVVGASSCEGGVVTNGMSFRARDGKNANSALLVSVGTDDIPGDDPLAGIDFQEELEARAFAAGGSDYFAPVMTVGEFLGEAGASETVEPTYRPGVRHASFDGVLPGFVTSSMREALPEMGKKLKGFDSYGAVMTAVETRSSSPVRILRDDGCESVSIKGLYPAGEGAGYAGGIMSASVDGLRAAESVISSIKRRHDE